MRVCKAYRTISYEASCVLANVLPLPNKVIELASLREVKSKGLLEVDGDRIPIQRSVLNERHPAQCIQGFVDFNQQDDTTGLRIFTDGSKSEDGVGSAYVVYEQSIEVHHRIFSLPYYCSVFQAELLALKMALEYLTTSLSPHARIYSDSLSSLMAIQCRDSGTPLVIEIQNQLLQLREFGVNVKLSWVKAHIGIIGNERADELAKSCWTAEAEPVELKAPISFAKRHIRMNQRAEWNTNWMAATNGSWARQIFPTIEHRRRAGPFRLDFVLTQFLSGHGKFGSYLNRFKIRRDP